MRSPAIFARGLAAVVVVAVGTVVTVCPQRAAANELAGGTPAAGLSSSHVIPHMESAGSGCGAAEPAALESQVYSVVPGPDVLRKIQEHILDAVPGDVIQLEAGRYQLPRQLDIAVAGLTIRLLFNKDRNWTRALKHMLVDLKFVLKYALVLMDRPQQPQPQPQAQPQQQPQQQQQHGAQQQRGGGAGAASGGGGGGMSLRRGATVAALQREDFAGGQP